MPGITGVISKSASPDLEHSFAEMLNALKSEQFHVADAYRNGNLSVGWVAFDGQPYASQAWNEDRTIGLVFCGEHYSDRGQVADLRGKGHQFDPAGNDWLVHLYEELGEQFY